MDIILSTKRGKLCTAVLVYNIFFNHIFISHIYKKLNESSMQFFTAQTRRYIYRIASLRCLLFYGAGGLDAFADSFTPLFAGLCNSSKQHKLSSWPLIFQEVIT